MSDLTREKEQESVADSNQQSTVDDKHCDDSGSLLDLLSYPFLFPFHYHLFYFGGRAHEIQINVSASAADCFW